MAKHYLAMDNAGSIARPTTTSASGDVKQLVYMGPTRGNEWQYSGAVNGTTTFYNIVNIPLDGRKLSAT